MIDPWIDPPLNICHKSATYDILMALYWLATNSDKQPALTCWPARPAYDQLNFQAGEAGIAGAYSRVWHSNPTGIESPSPSPLPSQVSSQTRSHYNMCPYLTVHLWTALSWSFYSPITFWDTAAFKGKVIIIPTGDIVKFTMFKWSHKS